MKTQVHFRGIHPVDDGETRRYAEELSERLNRIIEFYRDDQKRLRLVVEGTRQGYRVGGSITVPSKALYAEAQGDTLTLAMETLFERLRKELQRHRAIVRKEYVKKRKFAWQEDLRQAREALVRQAEDKKKEGFQDRFLPLLRGLYRTARRRIILHQLAGELDPGELKANEIIDELVWWEYENFHKRDPDADLAVELQRSLRDRIEGYIASRKKEAAQIPDDGPGLEDPRFEIAESDSDVFYEPPEKLRWEDILHTDAEKDFPLKDVATLNQTQIIYRTLSKLERAEREALVLHAIEGWEIPEIAKIAHIDESEVNECVQQSQRYLRHQLGLEK